MGAFITSRRISSNSPIDASVLDHGEDGGMDAQARAGHAGGSVQGGMLVSRAGDLVVYLAQKTKFLGHPGSRVVSANSSNVYPSFGLVVKVPYAWYVCHAARVDLNAAKGTHRSLCDCRHSLMIRTDMDDIAKGRTMAARHDSQKHHSTLLPMVAAGFFFYFVAALLLMHIIRPDYTIVDHMVSDYAVGRSGWIMTTAFFSASMGCLALAIGLFLDGPTSWLGRIGATLLVVAFAGLIVTALFPTDLETAASTRTGDIHTFSFQVNVASVLLSTICLALSYGGSPHWHRHRTPALVFAVLLVIAFVAQFLTLHRGAPYGITNRLFVAVLMAWFISNSFWLKSVAAKKHEIEI